MWAVAADAAVRLVYEQGGAIFEAIEVCNLLNCPLCPNTHREDQAARAATKGGTAVGLHERCC